MKNNIDVFYFSTLYPLHILFVEDGKMGESCSHPWGPGIDGWVVPQQHL